MFVINGFSDAAVLYEHSFDFLDQHYHHRNNYDSFRSELTIFLNWCFEVAKTSPENLTRKQTRRYLDFCQSPPIELVCYCNLPQFKTDSDGFRVFNDKWLPFRGKTQNGKPQTYMLSHSSLKTKVALLSTYYTYLIEEEFTDRNPILSLLKNNRLKGSDINVFDMDELKKFTGRQFDYVMKAAKQLAEQNVESERELFMLSLLYSCYLRISEISSRPGFTPQMNQFRKSDESDVWMFCVPRSKGGKSRVISVSDSLLDALKRYRKSLGLSPLPSADDDSPLFPRHRKATRGKAKGVIDGNLGSRQVRKVLMDVYDLAALNATEDGFTGDAANINKQCIHSLRHTGASDDINVNERPINHVKEDLGHNSLTTTSHYVHADIEERQLSAKNKSIGTFK